MLVNLAPETSWVCRVRALLGRPYDGHQLEPTVESLARVGPGNSVMDDPVYQCPRCWLKTHSRENAALYMAEMLTQRVLR